MSPPLTPEPVPPPPTRWALAAPAPGDDDLVAVGADLEPGTVLQAYALGLFPMGVGEGGRPPLGWWSPVRRGVLLAGDFHTSRSLHRTGRRFRVSSDTAFDRVVEGCADPRRTGAWITPEIRTAYARLHELGWAHSVEVWADDDLVGGLYGLALGGLFAGESMFSTATDASKTAVRALAAFWFADGDARRLVDVQWQTPHLASLGVREIPRAEYLTRLGEALLVPWRSWPRDMPPDPVTPPEN